MRAETKRQSIASFSFSWEYTRGATKVFFAALHMSMNEYECVASIDLEVTKKFQQVGKLTNTESEKKED